MKYKTKDLELEVFKLSDDLWPFTFVNWLINQQDNAEVSNDGSVKIFSDNREVTMSNNEYIGIYVDGNKTHIIVLPQHLVNDFLIPKFENKSFNDGTKENDKTLTAEDLDTVKNNNGGCSSEHCKCINHKRKFRYAYIEVGDILLYISQTSQKDKCGTIHFTTDKNQALLLDKSTYIYYNSLFLKIAGLELLYKRC